MTRHRHPVRPILAVALCCLMGSLAVRDLCAQLRPLDPFDWSVFEPGRSFAVRVGGAVYTGQRAALAGTEGRLVEVGMLHATWRIEHAAFEIGWTALRLFRDRQSFAPATGGARPPDGRERADVGDFRLATVVQFWSDPAAAAAFRFGTRLPTTDNGVGLERDQTDFFALVLGRAERRALALSLALGVGINGTPNEAAEQRDVMLYSARARYRRGRWSSSLAFVGQDSWQSSAVRGNEDLHEARVAVRFGRRLWVGASLVRGLTPFSPRSGVIVSAGAAF